MRLLFIIDSLSRGGKERRLVQLLKELQNVENIKIALVVLSESVQYDEVYSLNLEIIILKRKTKKDMSVFFKVYKICSEFKPDIVHSWGTMPSIYILPSVILKKIKFVNSSIVDAPVKLSLKIWIRTKLTFPFSDIITSNSIAGLKSYNVPSRKSKVIYNGFDFKRISNLTSPEDIRSRFNITTEYLIGMVSVFRLHKDHETVIKAAQKILMFRTDISFVLVGDGPTYEDCKRMAKYEPRIIFTGKQNEVESIMNACDIGVLTTNIKIHGEGISNSILEFMAVGKPVIATDGGGTGEIINNNQTGYLIEPGNPDQLADKILYLTDNADVRNSMGQEGRKCIEKKFDIDRMVKSFTELYNNLCEEE
ncbi:MAG: glycosyltransferase [Candidatus Delongbacteria bacterium]